MDNKTVGSWWWWISGWLTLAACAGSEAADTDFRGAAQGLTGRFVEASSKVARGPKPCDPTVDRICAGKDPQPCDPTVDRTCAGKDPQPCDPKRDKDCGDNSRPGTFDGCDRNRLIGLAVAGRCPEAGGGWSGEPLFGSSKVSAPGKGLFCYYTYVGPPDKYSVRGLPADPGSQRPPAAWLHPDCAVVVGLEAGAAQKALSAVTPAYVKGYRAQMAAVPLPSLGPSLPAGVRVAVLDSAPDGVFDPSSPGPEHGRVVGGSIRDLVCPRGGDTPCNVRLVAAQVLQQDTSSDVQNSYGYIGDLARQLVKVVDLHVGSPLVVNLSVGYHPKYSVLETADDVAQWHEATNALMSAVNYATCNGALVVAAAGNRDDGPMLDQEDSRPMFPASLGQFFTWGCPSSPLLYAASGVMPDDTELPNGRPGSTAGLVAPAFAVGVDMGPDNSQPLSLKTGSSFAASGVSAVAAVVWSYLPFVSAQKVMSIVRSSGVSLPSLGQPDFCNGTDCGVVKRVSVCNAASTAITAACNQPSVAPFCAGILPLQCSTPVAGSGTAVVPNVSVMRELAEEIAASYQSIGNTTCPVNPVWATDPNLGQEMLCADHTYPNAQSHPFSLSPLPGADPCQICFVLNWGDWHILYAAYQPSYSAGSLGATTLRTASDTPVALGAALSGAYGGNLVAVPLAPGLQGLSAKLSHQVVGEQTSVSSTVPIIKLGPSGFE